MTVVRPKALYILPIALLLALSATRLDGLAIQNTASVLLSKAIVVSDSNPDNLLHAERIYSGQSPHAADALTLLHLAQIAVARGEWASALRMLQQASATTPSNSVVTALLSRVYVEMGNYEAAVALWRDHRLAEPISNLVFRLYTDEKIDVNQARWMAEQAVLADSSSPTAWAEFGWTTYLQTHDADSAITALNRAVELDPDNWYPLLRLVQVYNAERAPEQALPYAQELVRRWPNLENAHYAMAETLQALGELEKAETELVRALELGPAPYVQERLADLYFQTGRLDQAISLWEAVLPQSPVYWRVHLKLARAYLSQGKPDLARAHVLLVKRDHIDDAQVQELMREIGE